MNNYSNPMVTYDEIIDALKTIIDCAKVNGNTEEYGFLNVKYDSLNQNPIQTEQEQALLEALQSLEKIIDSANEIIRKRLEEELERIDSENTFKIRAKYGHSSVKRKLASQSELVVKLKQQSLPLDVLFEKQPIVKEELPVGFEEIVEEEVIEPIKEIVVEPKKEVVKADINKIQLMKSALDKARENGNDQLASVLEQQLLRAIESVDLK